ncbi:hypothetical protein [Edaphobacter sp.]|uniref:hypothetical protein n=1 Tax=Edaphobacter sp. TaxID=1934404 RepID=UPI00345C0F17
MQARHRLEIVAPISTPATPAEAALALDPPVFRRRLMNWYRGHARELPWRGIHDPYRTWVSEVMLQQTRVEAVIDHYHDFLLRFPTVLALALAKEEVVLASWSGLGYYRRARMLHKAARFITAERGGILPHSALELRTLPGIGEYTSAAIASIAFGESIAVVDGNVEPRSPPPHRPRRAGQRPGPRLHPEAGQPARPASTPPGRDQRRRRSQSGHDGARRHHLPAPRPALPQLSCLRHVLHPR